MTLALIHTRAILGLQAPTVTVEVHLANDPPSFTLVGLADKRIMELSRLRARSACPHWQRYSQTTRSKGSNLNIEQVGCNTKLTANQVRSPISTSDHLAFHCKELKSSLGVT